MKLTVLVRDGKVLTDKLEAGLVPPECSIGCRQENLLVLSDDRGTIAGRHAVLAWREDNWYIHPEESATLAINGRRLGEGEEAAIRIGDFIEIGSYMLKVIPDVSPWEMAEKTGEQPLMPSWDETLLAWAGRVQKPTPGPTAENSETLTDPRDAEVRPVTNNPHQQSGLEDLVNLPVDPLSLFGAAPDGRGRIDSTTSSPEDVFSEPNDPVGVWDKSNPFHFKPAQDGLPAHEGHLRMKIATPDLDRATPASPDETIAPAATVSLEELASSAAPMAPSEEPGKPAATATLSASEKLGAIATAAASSKELDDLAAAVALPEEAVNLAAAAPPEEAVNLAAVAPLGKLAESAAAPLAEQPASLAPPVILPEELAGLAASFLQGAGVPPTAGTGGYTPQLMHALGQLIGELSIYAANRNKQNITIHPPR